MKLLSFLTFVFISALPCLPHYDAEDITSKPTFKKVKLSNETIKRLEIKSEQVKEKTVSKTIKTTGKIEELPNNNFYINSPVQGKVIKILVDLGTKIQSGQPLVQIQSTQIADLQAEVSKLEAELGFAKSSHEREKLLFEQGVSAKKDFEAAQSSYSSVEAKLNAAKNNLKTLTESTRQASEGTFEIKAKQQGEIVERNITVGQVVSSDQVLFRAIDLSKVWASADIYEKDAAKIKEGQKVFVTLDLEPSKVFEGKITYAGNVIDETTRILPVKATIQNTPDESGKHPLQIGAFIEVVVHTETQKKSIVIPRSALADIHKEDKEGKHKHVVYIKEHGTQSTFVPRKIEVESHDSNLVEVLSGLTQGEEIVTEGSYQLQYGKSTHEHPKQNNINHLLLVVSLVVLLVTGLFLMKKIKGKKLYNK